MNPAYISLKEKEIYVIDLRAIQSSMGMLLYAPLHNAILPLSPEDYHTETNSVKAKAEYREFINLPQTRVIDFFHRQQVDDLVRLSIIPTFNCNLACSYCYSAQGRKRKELARNRLEHVLNYFLSSKKSSRQDRYVSIVGGGEPLLAWDSVTKFAISRVRELEQQNHLDVQLGITTNGTLITREIAEFLTLNDVKISISFEILEEVQNLHRKHYEKVKQNLYLLNEMQIAPAVRMTVTPLNVHRLKESVIECAYVFPFIRRINMEYVISKSFFPEVNYLADFFQTFTKSFFEAQEAGEQHHIRVNTSVYQNLSILSDRFCSGDFCITPDGFVTACHRFTSTQEKHFADATYAHADDDGLHIDKHKFSRLMAYNVHREAKCRQCPVKWHCGGSCLSAVFNYSHDFQDVICHFKRGFLASYLYKLAKQA